MAIKKILFHYSVIKKTYLTTKSGEKIPFYYSAIEKTYLKAPKENSHKESGNLERIF